MRSTPVMTSRKVEEEKVDLVSHQAKLKKRAKKGDADAKAAKKQKKEEAKAAKKEAANGE